MKTNGLIILKKGREKKIKNAYPWIQKGEIYKTDTPEEATLIELYAHDNEFLGIGSYNPKSRFPVRIFDTTQKQISEEWFFHRFERAIAQRTSLTERSNASRIVFSEADNLPGLIIDQFDNHLIVQVRSLGMEKLRELWIPALIKSSKATSILERSDMAGRAEEGLGDRVEQIHGTTPDTIHIHEDGIHYEVPIKSGLKTGHYLDQRETKRRLWSRIKPGQKVLDCFCYTGGFSLTAAKANAQVWGVDIHETAIEFARKNAQSNKLEIPFVQANAFEFLENEASSLGPYDWIILDPPAIAKTKSKRDSLKWAIWKLVYLAIPLLAENGSLIVCSCSYQLDLKEMVETCRLAASDKQTRFTLDDVSLQDIDHPAPIHFPEALYLKCAWLRKLPN